LLSLIKHYIKMIYPQFDQKILNQSKNILAKRKLGIKAKSLGFTMGRKAVSMEVRQQIVGLLKDKANTNVYIANLVGVSEKCVRTTRKNVVGELPKSGRPRKLSYRDERSLYLQARVNPTVTNGGLAANLNVSRETVRRSLKRRGIGTYTAQRKCLLTYRNRRRRYFWCKERLHWSVEDWSRVIFSDESNFEVINRKNRFLVKRLKHEKYLHRFLQPRLQGGGGSVGIWGCISHKGSGVCELFRGRINQHRYRETLENSLIPSRDLMYGPEQAWIFQQDGAPAHTANSVKSWLEEQAITVLDWPPQSPDLNPIENIWCWMDAKLTTQQLTSLDQLKDAMEKLWQEVPRELCMTLVESMPRRVRACYKAKGGHFKS
jgi:hypothetical protein